MASSAIFLTIILPTIIASTSGFKIQAQTTESERFNPTPRFISAPTTDYRNQPIAGYPKVPPPNAYESGGNDFDLLPPFEDISVKLDPRRSIKDESVDPKTGYPLPVAEPSWKYAGGNEENLELPLDDSVDPKTGYPLVAKPHWKDAGGDDKIIPLPLNAGENFQRTTASSRTRNPQTTRPGGVGDYDIFVLPYLDPKTGMPFAGRTKRSSLTGKITPRPLHADESIEKTEVDPKTGYPLKADPTWKDAGGNEQILDLPLEDLNTRSGEAVDPKTGYPLVAKDSWKQAGGDEEILELPLEDSKAVDPKTGYPLVAQDSWKHAGGDEEILELPLEDSKAVDPKTGYPLVAQDSWKHAGGDEDILELPLEDSKAVDFKTGYPLQAQPAWEDAGGNGDILELPLEDNSDEGAVDPKTGYPLQANPTWKDAGGNGDILQLPLEDNSDEGAVDPKTGYPLTAQPSWKDAGGNGDILQLPLDDKEKSDQVPVDPKTGYPLKAQPGWKDAGGNGDILQVPLSPGEPENAVDPQTGYPLVAQPGWKDAGGNEDILQLPVEQPSEGAWGRFHVFEIFKLTELQPPNELSNSFSTADGATNQKQNSFGHQLFGFNRPVESTYTYTGPENVVVTVTRFLSTGRQNANGFSRNQQKPFNFNANSGVPIPTSAPPPNLSTFMR